MLMFGHAGRYLVALLTAVIVYATCGCRQIAPAPNAQVSNLPPTATEIFDLRSRCAILGEHIAQQRPFENTTNVPSSHYNPRTNRCYVTVDTITTSVERAHRNKEKVINFKALYDGQTGDLLMEVNVTDGQKWVVVPDDPGIALHNKTGEAGYNEALAIIKSFMADEHRP